MTFVKPVAASKLTIGYNIVRSAGPLVMASGILLMNILISSSS